MNSYKSFVRLLYRHYVIGSLVAVLGVGGVIMFSTLQVTAHDVWVMADTLLFSLLVMLGVESRVFFRDLRPIARAYQEPNPALETLHEAYLQLHRLPGLSVRRTLGPHLLGLVVPGCALSALEIHEGWLDLPQRYVVLAVLGCILVAGMHALIEFYLTSEAIRGMLNHLRRWAYDVYATELSLHGRVLISVRKKFVMSMLLLGMFPLLLFGLATQVHLAVLSDNNVDSFGMVTAEYWRWAVVVLVIGLLFSAFCALLMYRTVQQPIEQVLHQIRSVEQGRFDVRAEDTFSDEFAMLTAGFNGMVRGLKSRDDLNRQLLDSYFSTLAAALDARDPYTAGHSVRVAHFSYQIGLLSGLQAEELDLLRKAALLHDIGKIGVRDDVLLKEGRLTDEEFAQIKLHPVLGEAILLQIQPAEAMAPLLPGVRSHHERYDGHGYPDRLAGEAIPLFGRIIAVADAFDAMTSNRPYRQGMPVEKALAIMTEGRGTQWDPIFAGLFIDWVRRQNDDFMMRAEELEPAI